MKRIVLIQVLICISLVAMAQVKAGADYQTYVETHKDYWGVSLSIPQSMIEKDAEGQMVLWRIFQFSSAEDRGENYPIFYSGPIVNIDKNCVLVMPFLFFEQKPRPAYEAPITEHTVPNHSAIFSHADLHPPVAQDSSP